MQRAGIGKYSNSFYGLVYVVNIDNLKESRRCFLTARWRCIEHACTNNAAKVGRGFDERGECMGIAGIRVGPIVSLKRMLR